MPTPSTPSFFHGYFDICLNADSALVGLQQVTGALCYGGRDGATANVTLARFFITGRA